MKNTSGINEESAANETNVHVDRLVMLPDGYLPSGERRPYRKAKVISVSGRMAEVKYCDDGTKTIVTIKAFMEMSDML